MNKSIILELIKNKKWKNIVENINKIDINKEIYNKNYLIHYAGYYNCQELFKIIVKNKGDINIKNNDGNTIGHIAAMYGYFDLLKLIIKNKKEILNSQNAKGQTILHIILNENNLLKEIFDLCEKDIKSGKIDINLLNEHGFHILSLCILNTKRLSLDSRVKSTSKRIRRSIRKKEEVKEPIIFVNAGKGKSNKMEELKDDNDVWFKSMKIILDHNPKINWPNNILPLLGATVLQKSNVVKLLLERGADVNLANSVDETALYAAVRINNSEITKLLLDNGADVNFHGKEGNKFIFTTALRYSDDKIINNLLEYDIDFNFTNNYLDTPAHYILYSKKNEYSIEIKREIIKRTKDINQINLDGDTVLLLLLKNDDWKKYEDILLDKKLDIFIKNKRGEMPLNYVKGKLQDIVVESYLKKMDKKGSYIINEKIIKCKNNNDCDNNKIMNIMIDEQKSYPREMNLEDTDIKLDNYKYVNYSLYNARKMDEDVFLLYILRKHDNVTIPYCKKKIKENSKYYLKSVDNKEENTAIDKINSMTKSILYFASPLYYSTIHWYSNKINYVPNDFERVMKNMKKRYIFIFLSLIGKGNINHANILICDTKEKTVERFDPYGYIDIINSNDADVFFGNLFKKMFKYKYYSPKDYMKVNSFQTLSDEDNIKNKKHGDPEGFCLAWIFWYLELRLNNENINRKKLLEKALKNIINSDTSIMEYIRNYANHLSNKQTKIFLDIGINEKELYNSYTSKENLKKIYNYITDELNTLL